MTKREGDQPLVDLGRALEWALYWIRHCAEVPVPSEALVDEQDAWQRWEEASRALRTWGPESGYAAEAYREAYRAPFRILEAEDG